MKFWRSWLMPLYPTGLFVVSFIAALHALVYSVESAGPLRILPALILLAWLFKYAYAFLEQAAEGIAGAPVPSVEMLGPFEFRPLLQVAVCVLVYTVVSQLPGLPGKIVAGLSLVLLPASIGALGVTGSALEAANPVTLWRLVRGLGGYYVLIIAAIVCYAFVIVLLSRLALWNIALFALADLFLLSLYAAIGGAIYERRLQLGYEPRSSPERQLERDTREHTKLLGLMLDEAYYPLRVGEVERAIAPLKQWLGAASAERLETDVVTIMGRAMEWNHLRGLQAVTRCVVSTSILRRKLALAIEAVELALRQLPRFALDTEEETTALATYAKAIGRKSLALTLIRNLQLNEPARPLGQAAAGLQRELES